MSALDGDDSVAAGAALRALIATAPSRWVRLLFLGGAVPGPRAKNGGPRLATLLKGAMDDAQPALSLTELERVSEIVLSYSLFATVFSAVKRKLDGNPLLSDPLQLVARLASYVESQAFIASERHAPSSGTLDLDTLLHSTLQTAGGGARMDLGTVIEASCEAIELVVRYTQHTTKTTRGQPVSIASPYEDPALAELLAIAHLWRMYEELWARIRFLDWRPLVRADLTIVVPRDEAEFWREQVGIRRMERIRMGLLTPIQAGALAHASDSADQIARLAATLNLPDSLAEAWDGVVDIDLLRACCMRPSCALLRETALDFFYYRSYADSVRAGDGGGVDWLTWTKVADLLRILAAAAQAVLWRRPGIDGHNSVSAIFRVDMRVLAEVVADSAQLEMPAVLSALAVLTLDARRKHLEIWDQPLIPYSDNSVLVIPSLILSGDPTRAAENLTAQWPVKASTRGDEFENAVAKVLQPVAEGVAVGVRFDASDGEVEFDCIVWWGGHLILVECKCAQSIHGAADFDRTRANIEESVEQLRRRRRIVEGEWDALRAAAPAMSLPEVPPVADRIHCVSVTNTTLFSGLEDRGVVVTDIRCLSRYFESPRVSMITLALGRMQSSDTGRVIRKERANPAGLVRYLAAPPQVDDVRRQLRAVPVFLPIITLTSPKVAFLAAEFSAADASPRASHWSRPVQFLRAAWVALQRGFANLRGRWHERA